MNYEKQYYETDVVDETWVLVDGEYDALKEMTKMTTEISLSQDLSQSHTRLVEHLVLI